MLFLCCVVSSVLSVLVSVVTVSVPMWLVRVVRDSRRVEASTSLWLYLATSSPHLVSDELLCREYFECCDLVIYLSVMCFWGQFYLQSSYLLSFHVCNKLILLHVLDVFNADKKC